MFFIAYVLKSALIELQAKALINIRIFTAVNNRVKTLAHQDAFRVGNNGQASVFKQSDVLVNRQEKLWSHWNSLKRKATIPRRQPPFSRTRGP